MEVPDATDMVYAACSVCVHKSLSGPTCTAYPRGIPDEILRGEVSHLTPYPGDNGIVFTPAPGAGEIKFGRGAVKVFELQDLRGVWEEARLAAEKWNREWRRLRWRTAEVDLKAEYEAVMTLMEKAHEANQKAGFGRLPKLQRLDRWGTPPDWYSEVTG